MLSRLAPLILVLGLVACGDDAPSVEAPAQGSCPATTSFTAVGSSMPEFSLEPSTSFVFVVEDDSLYGDHYQLFFADYDLEPGDTSFYEVPEGNHVIEIDWFRMDKELPTPGTYPYVTGENTIFSPGARTADSSYLPTTIGGEGSEMTISVADEERVCGAIDVHDSSGSIRGTFEAPIVPDPNEA